ncbi:hypothetical protein AAG906_016382 [Vitis piasezkii]
MDEVSLNSEPVYDDEGDEFEIEGDCAMTEYVGQTGIIQNPCLLLLEWSLSPHEDVYYFYNCYAKEQGFGVRVSNTWYRKSKERYRGKLSCSSAGFKRKVKQTAKTGNKNWLSSNDKIQIDGDQKLEKLYTNDIFKKFQREVEGLYSCFSTRQIHADGRIVTYMVKEHVEVEENRRETRDYEVSFDTSEMEVFCVCGLFNFKGYLCRHALTVLNQNGMEEIPPQYILSRWRKDTKRTYVLDHGCSGIDINNPVHRYDHLYRCVVQVVEEARKSQDRYKDAIQALDEILNKDEMEALDRAGQPQPVGEPVGIST